MSTLGSGNGEPVNVRELYTHLGGMKNEIIAEVNKLSDEMDKRFDVHNVEHERERDQRNATIRWAVTSVVAMTGVFVSIYLAATGKG